MVVRSPSLNENYRFQYLNLGKRSGTQFGERFNLENVYYAIRQTGELAARLVFQRPWIFDVHVTEYWDFERIFFSLLLQSVVAARSWCRYMGHVSTLIMRDALGQNVSLLSGHSVWRV
jgi:hypothetical protein